MSLRSRVLQFKLRATNDSQFSSQSWTFSDHAQNADSEVRKRPGFLNGMIYLELRDLCLSFVIAWNAQNAASDTWLRVALIAMGLV